MHKEYFLRRTIYPTDPDKDFRFVYTAKKSFDEAVRHASGGDVIYIVDVLESHVVKERKIKEVEKE